MIDIILPLPKHLGQIILKYLIKAEKRIMSRLHEDEKAVFLHMHLRVLKHNIYQNENFRNSYWEVIEDDNSVFGKRPKNFCFIDG